MSAAESRLDAAVEAGIPNIVSLGATDMVNFGPRATVPEKYKGRKLFEHNPEVTLMRTSEDECRQTGEFICSKLRKGQVSGADRACGSQGEASASSRFQTAPFMMRRLRELCSIPSQVA